MDKLPEQELVEALARIEELEKKELGFIQSLRELEAENAKLSEELERQSKYVVKNLEAKLERQEKYYLGEREELKALREVAQAVVNLFGSNSGPKMKALAKALEGK